MHITFWMAAEAANSNSAIVFIDNALGSIQNL